MISIAMLKRNMERATLKKSLLVVNLSERSSYQGNWPRLSEYKNRKREMNYYGTSFHKRQCQKTVIPTKSNAAFKQRRQKLWTHGKPSSNLKVPIGGRCGRCNHSRVGNWIGSHTHLLCNGSKTSTMITQQNQTKI